jgi:hypothetical protein
LTYLEVVNRVLRRLRENEVSTVNETPYSKLIGDLVNVVKAEIEDSWDWSALRDTMTVVTTPILFNYVLTGVGTRFRVLDVINDTDNFFIEQRSAKWFDQQFLMASEGQSGSPVYYNFNGVDPNGDIQVDLFPIPDAVYDIRMNMVIPQAELVQDSTKVLIPSNLLVEGTLARALEERGEDGGNLDQQQRYDTMLSNLIAFESLNREDEITWGAV